MNKLKIQKNSFKKLLKNNPKLSWSKTIYKKMSKLNNQKNNLKNSLQ